MGKRKALKASKKKVAAKKRTPKAPSVNAATVEKDDLASLQKIFEAASRTEVSSYGLRTTDVECPYCGEEFEISLDPSEEGQEMIQDCQVCCRPITFSFQMEEGELFVSAHQD